MSSSSSQTELSVKTSYIKSAVLLGTGSFSSVYKGACKSDNTPVAVKVFNAKVLPSTAREECELCANLMRLDIPGIVKFFEVVQNETVPIYEIAMEILSGGELFDRIANRNSPFTESNAASTMFSLIQSISQLHRRACIIHADIKPENVVFVNSRDDSPFRIIDFGLSIQTTLENVNKGIVMKELVGTYGYMAPETYFSRTYSAKADMWSIGVILYILLSGTMPFDVDSKNFEKKLKVAQYYSIDSALWSKVSNEAKDLLRKLLVVDPRTRLSSIEALDHPWFVKYNLNNDITENGASISSSNSSSNIISKSASSKPKEECDVEFDTEYINRLKALNLKQRMRKVINGVIWTNRVQRCLLSKTLMGAGINNVSDAKNADADKSKEEINKETDSKIGGGGPSDFPSTPFKSQTEIDNSLVVASEKEVIGQNKSKEELENHPVILGDGKPSVRLVSPTHYASTNEKSPITLKSVSGFDKNLTKSPSTYSFIEEHQVLNSEDLIYLGLEDLYRFKSIFESIIKDPNISCIEYNQFCQACDRLGLSCLAKRNIFDIFDRDRKGTIEYREFLVALTGFHELTESSMHLYFDLFDKNGDGSLSMDEFKYVVGSCLSFTDVTSNLNSCETEIQSSSLSSSPGKPSLALDDSLSSSPPPPSLSSSSFQAKIDILADDTIDTSGSNDFHVKFRDVFSIFMEMDTNKDGFISFEEFSSWMRKNFKSVSHNFRLNLKINS